MLSVAIAAMLAPPISPFSGSLWFAPLSFATVAVTRLMGIASIKLPKRITQPLNP